MTRHAPSRASAAVLLIVSLAACAAPSPAEFQPVASSGVTFAESVPPLLNTALSEAIAANSATLIREHATATEDARKTALLDANEAYRERAKVFADVSNHAALLNPTSWRSRHSRAPAATAPSEARRRAS